MIGARKGPGVALGTPNKVQNGTNKEQNWGLRTKMGPFWVLSFMNNENISSKYKFKTKGADLFTPPPNFIAQMRL